MVHAEGASKELGAVKVVDGQVRRPLVLVREERKAARLSRVLVPDKVEIGNLAISITLSALCQVETKRVLGEEDDQVAFRHVVRQAADKDVGAVLVLIVPGGLDPARRLSFVDPLDLFYDTAKGTG